MTTRTVGSSPARPERKVAPSLPRGAVENSRRSAVSPIRQDARAASRSKKKDSPKQTGNESATGSRQQSRTTRSNSSPTVSTRDVANKIAASRIAIDRIPRADTAKVNSMDDAAAQPQPSRDSSETLKVEKSERKRDSSPSVRPTTLELGEMPLQEISAKLDRLNLLSGRQAEPFGVGAAGLGHAMRNLSLSAQLPTITREHASSSSTVRGSSPASRSTSPYRRDLSNGKPLGFQEPLGVSIELGMELVRRNRQLEREVRKLTGSSGEDSQASSSQNQKEFEELTQDLARVCRWAEEAERLQREACRTILVAVRKEAPEGRDVYQALAQLAAFPPPPLRHSQAGSAVNAVLNEELLARIESTQRQEKLSNGIPSKEILESNAGQSDPDVAQLNTELTRIRSERNHAVKEKRKAMEQMQSLQDRVETTEGIAKELVVKLASICQLCDGVPIALAEQQAAAIAALNSLSTPSGQIAGQPAPSSPASSAPRQSYPSMPPCNPQLEELLVKKTCSANLPSMSVTSLPTTPNLVQAEACKARPEVSGHERSFRHTEQVRASPLRLFGSESRPREERDYPNYGLRDLQDIRASSAPPESHLSSTRSQTPPSRWHSGSARVQWLSPSPPSPAPVPPALQDAIFNVLDTNKDGMITREELSNALRAGIIQEGRNSDTMRDLSVKAPRPIMVSSASNFLAASESPMRPIRGRDSPLTASPVGSPLASPLSRSRSLVGNTTPVLPVVLHTPIVTPVASGEFPSVATSVAPLSSLYKACERTSPAFFSPGLAFRDISSPLPPLLYSQVGLK